MNKKVKLVVILGPTASGKSSLGIFLAKKFKGEIVSADSRQIYQGMTIGTDKISRLQAYQNTGAKGQRGLVIEKISHYMIDIVTPDQEYSVGEFKKEAVKIIQDIHQRGKLPFLVGGTGLYIQAVVDNLNIPEVLANKKLRKKLEAEITQDGLEKVWQKLVKLDPTAGKLVQKENSRRVIRALEVCLATGRPFSGFQTKGEPLFDVLQIGIEVPRQELYQKIDQRVDEMIQDGLVEEVQNLAQKYDWNLPALSGIGYKEIGEHLRGEASLKEVVQKIKFNTHRYVRSQLSWFRRDRRIKWVKDKNGAAKLVNNFLV